MSVTAALDASASAINDDLSTLHKLLAFVASGEAPTREKAVVYATCRARLLASAQGKILPGFLYQCATIDRFRDFIHLYDPEVELRLHFVGRMIDRARPRIIPRSEGQRRQSKAQSWEF